MRAPTLVTFLILAACGGATPAESDGGITPTDGGADTLAPDAFVAPDAGDGICGEVTSSRGWPALPASCLPRCSAATGEAFHACIAGSDTSCVLPILEADTTPPAWVSTPAGPLEVTCGGSATETIYSCPLWQAVSCRSDLCPDAYDAYIACYGRTGGPCDAEWDALDRCARTDPDWTTCLTTRSDACFAPP